MEEGIFMRRTLILMLAAALVLLLAVPVQAGGNGNFVAPLDGGQEVPPVDTNGSGVAKFQLSRDGTELGFKLIVANTQDVTQAHIHCGAAGVDGPVVAFLYGGPTVSPNGILSQGTLTAGDVIAAASSTACPGGVADFAALIAKMASGDAYVNVHTVNNPGGEIRGQIK